MATNVADVGGAAQQPAAAINPIANAVAGAAPVRVAADVRRRRIIGGIRRRRAVYTVAQKERAVRMLNMGMTCRQVARQIGPHCSSGTPIRWRMQMRAAADARARMENAIRNAGQNPAPVQAGHA